MSLACEKPIGFDCKNGEKGHEALNSNIQYMNTNVSYGRGQDF